jgi:hypothetical protein
MAKRKSTYSVISKQFTKLNKKLPEEKKIAYKDRIKIIKEEILPKFKGIPKSKLRIKPINAAINASIDKIPPKEICDLNFIDVAAEYGYVEWFALDETISEIVPDCVYVKVTAGQFGETNIFNTRNYEYNKSGVRAIVEDIRPAAANTSGRYFFSGYQKLRPKKKNNGKPENYYLDLVMFEMDTSGNMTPWGSTDSTKFEPKKSKENTAKKKKIKTIIEKKIKGLSAKRQSRARARKSVEQTKQNFGKIITRLSKRKDQDKAVKLAREILLMEMEKLNKLRKEGKITEKQYKDAFEKLFRDFNSL